MRLSLLPGTARHLARQEWHAKNQYVWDADGKQYLDFFGGIVTVSVGHCNDDVNRKVHQQMDRLQHVSTVFANEPQAALAKKLAQITPAGKLTKSFSTSSGTEANETAILAARCYTGLDGDCGAALCVPWTVVTSHGPHSAVQLAARTGDASRYRACHERLLLSLSLWAGLSFVRGTVRAGCRTGDPNHYFRPHCRVYRGADSRRSRFVTPPKEFFLIVAETVKKHGGVFISDEVQTGWGRTGGKWFGIEQWGVQPDIITSAKGVGNGLPIGLTIARPEIADAVKGASISTFGGNPIATTAARAVIDFIEEHNLSINAAEVGAHFRDRLLELQAEHPLIGDVRGMGLLQAIELMEDPVSKTPAVAQTLAVMEAARENGILLGKGGLHGNILRFSPPLNISKTDVDEFARLLDASLVKASALAFA